MNKPSPVIIKNGRVFDGSGGPSLNRHVTIQDGLITHISEDVPCEEGARVIDARGQWVMPGFIDTHTHYEAELMATPGLTESVRHGVTTVITGSCSLSAVYVDPLDCADLYSRVEALPYEPVMDIFTRCKDWDTPEGWIQHLNRSALGPNVASMIGHSDIRAKVMGLGRSTTGEKPTKSEKREMVRLLDAALDAGFVGMSSMTNPWDKLAGERYRSRALPSTYATWGEYGELHQSLRRADRVLQSAPNLNTKVNIIRFFASSAALPWRRSLKTALISAADPKASSWLYPLFGAVTRFVNWMFRSRLRWQAVPGPFEIYADGIDLVVFEEFGAGSAALHLADEIERNALLKTEAYRRRFRRDYEKLFTPRIWHRDFYDAMILSCPESDVVGKSVGAVADARGIHPCDAFLDLVVTHGKRFRWKTVIANHRPDILNAMLAQPHVHIGFADSGAHLRNMAFYNFPLQLLKRVKDAEAAGRPFMTVERAVHRLTGEPAEWFGLDAGRLAVGHRADVAIINPDGLDETLDGYHEASMPEMGGLMRMVRRNDAAVTATLIGGQVAFEGGQYVADYADRPWGRFLRAGVTDRAPLATESAHTARDLALTA